MGILHAKSNPIPDYTGTVTVHNSTGGTTTVAAGNLVRPSDWNSEHNEFRTIVGNFDPTMNTTASGTNLVYAGGDGLRMGVSNCVFPAKGHRWCSVPTTGECVRWI